MTGGRDSLGAQRIITVVRSDQLSYVRHIHFMWLGYSFRMPNPQNLAGVLKKEHENKWIAISRDYKKS